MSSDSRTTATIEELIADGAIVAHKDGNYGSSYPRVEEFGTEGVPFLTAKSLSAGYVDIAGAPRLGDARADELRFGFVQTDDVLLSHNATIGRVAVLPQHKGRLLVGTSLTYFRLNPQKLLPRYLAVYLAGAGFQNQLVAVMSHSTRNQVPVTAQRKLHVVVPPLAEQKAIAEVLGALDDKIELNRRMNATLETMARALFQSWFVDFDPVRANLDGTRVAGVERNTAALFPARLEDSPLGKVPIGWSVFKFADLLTPHSVRVGENSVPEFSATMTGLSSRDGRFKKQLSKSQSKNKQIVEGDLVFGFSREVINFGLMREPVGAVSPVYEVFKIETSKIEPELLERLFRFNMPFYMDILKPGAREGKPIDRDYLLRKHLLVPDIAVQRAFLATIQPWTDKIKANEAESRTLVTLRDTLLPKLLSGELSLRPDHV